ncbi:MAG: HK97 gp10 family phage protein [Pseudonocardiaceae bacterium]
MQIDGLSEFLRDLKRFEPAVSKQFRTRLRKAVEVVAKDAQRRAPKKSGKLAKGIGPSVTNTGARLLSKAPHARIQEFGGRHPVFGNRENWVFQPARPHIFPAVDAGREEVNTEALAALDDAIKGIGFRK